MPLPDDGLPLPPLPARDTGLLGQTHAAVARLDASLGRTPDETTDRVAYNLAAQARRDGLERVDHVVLGVPTDRLRAGENLFAVQGELHAPDNRIAYLRSADAAAVPSADTVALARASSPAALIPEAAAQRLTTPELDTQRLVRT